MLARPNKTYPAAFQCFRYEKSGIAFAQRCRVLLFGLPCLLSSAALISEGFCESGHYQMHRLRSYQEQFLVCFLWLWSLPFY